LVGLSRIIKPAKVLRAILFLVLLHHSVPAVNATSPSSFSIALAWDGSPSPKVTGYRVYYGTASGKYSKSVKVGKVTTASVPRLVSGVTYYFAITSCGKHGQESSFSNEVSYVRGLPEAKKANLDEVQTGSTHAVVGIEVTGTGQPVLTVQGLVGITYYILAAETATDWAVIGTVKLDTNGSAEFIDTNAASFQQRFYRVQQKP